MLGACRHTRSNLHESGEPGPHEIEKPNKPKWRDNVRDRAGHEGGKTNRDIDPNPKDAKQDVSGKGPESRPPSGERKGGSVNIYEAEGETRVHMNSFILRGPAPTGDGENIGTLNADEKQAYPHTSFSNGRGTGDRSYNSGGGSTGPSRSKNFGTYKKVYKNFEELKKDVASRETEHKESIVKAVDTFMADWQESNTLAQVTSYVDQHNTFVASVTQKQPLIASMMTPSGASQLTPPNTAEGRQVQIAKNYSRYVRESIRSGHEKGHRESEKLLDFADASSDIADEFYSEGYKAEGNTAIATALAAVDLAIDFAPGFSLAKDIVSITTGVNPVTGNTLSSTEIAITTAALFIPSAFSGAAKAVRKASILARKVSNTLFKRGKLTKIKETLTTSFQDLSKILVGPKFSKLLVDLEHLPGGRHVKRALPGTNGKVAIIGRYLNDTKNGGVKQVAEYLGSKGHSVETFSGRIVSEKAQTQWDKATDFGKIRLKNNKVVRTLMYKENKSWATKLRREGYIVLDITDNNTGFSPFYAFEKWMVFGDDIGKVIE